MTNNNANDKDVRTKYLKIIGACHKKKKPKVTIRTNY